jgi:hypothetical protein
LWVVVVVDVVVDWAAEVSVDVGGAVCASDGEAITKAAIDAMRNFITFLLLFGQRLHLCFRRRKVALLFR